MNLVLLGATKEPRRTAPVLVGAVLPDLPIVAMYAYERLRGMPEAWIWGTGYYAPHWQAVIDALHSFPLILMVLGGALLLGWPRLVLVCASMLLHAAVDFFLHHDDAHRHFFPILDWRFASPVSYWDPRHYGNIAAPAEAIGVVAACALIARTTASRPVRYVVGIIAALYFTYLVFAWHQWAAIPFDDPSNGFMAMTAYGAASRIRSAGAGSPRGALVAQPLDHERPCARAILRNHSFVSLASLLL